MLVEGSGKNEQIVRQAIQVDQHLWVQSVPTTQCHHIPLRPATDRARLVCPRRGKTAAREHETGKRFQGLIEPIDRLLQPLYLGRSNPQLLALLLLPPQRGAQVSADVEEIILNQPNERPLGHAW